MAKLIYIADDDGSIRSLEATFLRNSGFEVQTFENGDLLLARFEEQPADLLVLDIMMPGTDGLTLCARIRETSNVPIIIVSAKGSEMERVTGITIGCDDYLAKPFSPIELVARVNAILRRVEMYSREAPTPAVLSYGDLTLDTARREVSQGGVQVTLTPNEFALLTYLIHNRDRAVSRDELLKKVWDFSSEAVDTRATDDAMKRLRRKLADYESSVGIQTVRGFGFKVVCDDEGC